MSGTCHWRVTLAQSVLLFISNFFMQFLMIPRGIYEEIERSAGQFIWGSLNGRKKFTIVNWDLVCQPRSCGGLAFHRLEDQNNSFLMKLGFNLASNGKALWVRVLCSKYGMKERLLESIS